MLLMVILFKKEDKMTKIQLTIHALTVAVPASFLLARFCKNKTLRSWSGLIAFTCLVAAATLLVVDIKK
jgi:hypothetical protein